MSVHGAVHVRADTPALARPPVVEVARYALAHDHTIIAWFRDSLTTARSGHRPGFGHCLRALSAGIATTVIVPTVEHLAPPGRLRQWLVNEIHTFGGQLLVVSPDPTLAPAAAGPVAGATIDARSRRVEALDDGRPISLPLLAETDTGILS